MAKFIDVDKLSGIAFQIKQFGKGVRCVVDLNDVDNIPSVEIVQCRECIRWHSWPSRTNGTCSCSEHITLANHFCSYGRR